MTQDDADFGKPGPVGRDPLTEAWPPPITGAICAWFSRMFGAKKPSAPPSVPIDEQPGILGDLLRLGEAASGSAVSAEQEQAIANKP